MNIVTKDRAELDPHFSRIVAFRGTVLVYSSIAIEDVSISGVGDKLRGILTFEYPVVRGIC
jgi:hypothetical protein